MCIKELLRLAADASGGLEVKIHVQIKALSLGSTNAQRQRYYRVAVVDGSGETEFKAWSD
jgi:hypothetical protein